MWRCPHSKDYVKQSLPYFCVCAETMQVLMLFTLSWSVSVMSALLCDITKTVRTNEDDRTYFSLEEKDTCYVFSLKKFKVKEAQSFCRSIGGSLTDVESRTDNSLQKLLAEEKKNLGSGTSFWIGLMWNYHVGYWYWDNGVTQVFRLNDGPDYVFTFGNSKACMSMTEKNLVDKPCGEEHGFICKLDILDQGLEVTNTTNSSCYTPRCAEYIKIHKSEPETTVSTTTTTLSGDDTTTDAGGNTSSSGAQDKCLAQCFIGLADCQLVLILIASLGALAAILLVTSIVMCAKLIQYRRKLSDKDSPTRISMVDILHADSPSTARRKRPGNHSGSNPGSTSELLNTNPYNTYATPDSDVGQAAESPDFIYQENGYSSVVAPSRSGEVATPDSQPGRIGNVYMLLNRDMVNPDQNVAQNVYGLASAATAPTDSRKTSDAYEIYANQQ